MKCFAPTFYFSGEFLRIGHTSCSRVGQEAIDEPLEKVRLALPEVDTWRVRTRGTIGRKGDELYTWGAATTRFAVWKAPSVQKEEKERMERILPFSPSLILKVSPSKTQLAASIYTHSTVGAASQRVPLSFVAHHELHRVIIQSVPNLAQPFQFTNDSLS